MNMMRIVLAALGAFVAYFVSGGIMFVAMPWMKTEFKKYPAVYRSHESIMKVMPAGMAAMFVSIAVLAVIYAMGYHVGAGLVEGARFGALIGVSAVLRRVGRRGVVVLCLSGAQGSHGAQS